MSDGFSVRSLMGIALAGATAISFAPMLYAISGEGPLTGAFFRMLYAIPVLWLMSLMWGGTDERDGHAKWMAFGAGLVLAFDFVSYHSAIDWVGTGIATLIGNSQVIIVTLLSWWLLGERPNKAIMIALPVVILGLLFISGIWDDSPYGEKPKMGVIAGVFTAFFYSAFLIIYRYANKSLAPATKLQFEATAGGAFGLLILGVLPLNSLNIEPIAFQPTFPAHAWLLLLAVMCQCIGWVAITYSLPRLPAAHTSFAILLQPVLTIVWGILLLGESPSSQQTVGMILILTAVIGVTLRGTVEATANDY
ncbi:MAG: DMT family transporter [Candidatus Thermoplasmatota archaeon]|nr:DMT family transporter [Candidatus Thermoplasmatota archaeon]